MRGKEGNKEAKGSRRKMKLLKPSWVSHNGKLVQESAAPTWAFVVGGGGR